MDIRTLIASALAVICFVILAACQRQEQDKKSPTSVADNASAPVEITLSIIKPNAVADNHIGGIIARLESAGLRIAAIKMVQLTKEQAEQFYAVHKTRPFYNNLVTFMTSGPVVVMALEGPNAVAKNREVMGATDPKKAASGTIRADFGDSVERNAVHGSDAVNTAEEEVAFFFHPDEINERFPSR